MPMPAKVEGSRYAFLRITNKYLVFQTNGTKRLIENVHYYGPGPGQCGPSGSPWSASQKAGLVTYSTGAAGPDGVTRYGFQKTVVNNILNSLLNAGALSYGIFAKWIDVTTDADLQVGTNVPSTIPPTSATVGNGTTSGGNVGTLPTRLALDNHVTVRKYTGVAGKEWSRGRWKFAPIDESQVEGDELNAAAKSAWAALKAPLYAPITDGSLTAGVANLMYPILVSMKLSQLMRMPTRVAYANLVLPGYDYIQAINNPVINATLGEQANRKEKPSVTF